MPFHINPDGSRSKIFDASYYRTGLNDDLRNNLKSSKRIVNRGYPVIWLVDGGNHTGKTETMVTMASYVQPDFNFKKQVGRGIEQFEEAWENTINTKSESDVRVCVFDEAQTYTRKGAMSSLNKAINLFFTTYRYHKVMLILGLPHIRELDVGIFDTDAVVGLIHMERLFSTYAEYRQFDAYQIAHMLDLLAKEPQKKHRNRRQIYNRVGFAPYGNVRKRDDSEEIAESSNSGKEVLQKAVREKMRKKE
jgi:hypothetical protein